MKTAQFSAIIDGVSKKKDSTLSIKLGTQELSSEETATIFDFGNQQIWVAFAEVFLKESDLEIPDFIPEYKGQKPFSQRLAEVLHVLWEQQPDKKGKTSRQFYESYMEKLIENIKSKLR